MKIFLTALALFFSCTAPAQIIHRVAGTVGVGGYSGVGGPATAAVIQNPESVALDTFGNLYIADGDNDVIQKVDRMGIITTIAGNGWRGYSGDGGPATNATLNSPTGLSLDLTGNIYFADYGNHVVRMINAAGIILTIAGNGMIGDTGNGGAATMAQLNGPIATAIDDEGNLYISDQNADVVRKVSSSGIISTVAGTGLFGYYGDGGAATNAQLFGIYGIAVDDKGNLFIADSHNNVIRKVDTFGIITTIAGNVGGGGYSGDGGPATAAQLNTPFSIGINNLGMYMADFNNNVIRKIDTSGIISTVAGDGVRGYTGDGGLAIYAELTYPGGMAVDRYGNFYFVDATNFVVREVDTSHAKENISLVRKPYGLCIYPNPATIELTITSVAPITAIDITNDIGEKIYAVATTGVLEARISVANFSAGLYFIKINDTEITEFLKQ